MPGYLVHEGAQVICAHSGQAKPTAPNPRVKVSGQSTVLLNVPYTISGCTCPPPSTGNGPCVSAQWTSGTTRVKSNGQPLVIQSSQATCTPTGTPLTITVTQTRVKAT